MDELPASRSELWKGRVQCFRQFVRSGVPFASGVLAALVALLLYNGVTPQPPQLSQDEVSTSIANAIASVTPRAAYSAYVYQIIRPSLVLIQAEGLDKDGKSEKGLGSGVIIDDSGSILTSLHVVDNAISIKVTFADGTQSQALILVEQPENDIAVLGASQLPAQLIPATLGNPNAMNVGDEAYVVGNPFGLYSSMSAGVISGFERSFQDPDGSRTLKGLIQIDTAVNPGNSGGPLLNRSGQVVGIVTALLNPTKEDFFIGIGFAVPITAAGGAAGLPPY